MVVAGIGTVVGTSLRAPIETKAADTTISYTNIGSDLGGTANSTVSTVSVSPTGSGSAMTLNYLQCKKQGNSMLMTKNVHAYISNKTAVPGTIKSVTLHINSGAAGKTTYDVAFGTSEFNADTAGIGAVNITGGNSHTFSNYNTSTATYSVEGATYFCITLGNANNGQVLGFDVTYASSSTTEYAVTFDSDGGSTNPDPLAVEKNKTFTFPSAGTKVGHIFAGWSSDGGTTKYQEGDTSPAVTANIAYTAYWTEDPIDTVTVAKGTFKTEYVEGDEWDWEHLVVTYTTESGAGGTAEGLTKEDFVFSPSAPAIGVESVSVQVTFEEVTSTAFVIDGLTVEEAPLEYIATFGTEKDTNPKEIETDAKFHELYPSLSADVTVGGLSKVYGVSGSLLKCASKNAAASISFTLPEDRYFTAVEVVVDTGNSTNLDVTSGASEAQTESQGLAAGTLTFDDYLGNEKSNVVTLASSAPGAFYLASIRLTYAYFEPELTANFASFDVATNESQAVSLTPTHFTPTSYGASIVSGTSLTASSVEFNENTATITAGENTGVSVVRITGTDGVKSAYVDITVNVTQPRNLLGLEIIGGSENVEFKVGQAFNPELLQVRATFDAEPTEVIYSAENSNLNLLTFDPELGHVFTEGEIGSVIVRVGLTVGTGSDLVVYGVKVVDKAYVAKTESVTDLWEGQFVSFGSADGKKVSGSHTGGNQLPGVDAVVSETRGLCIDDSPNAAAYRVHREMIDDTIYYSFFRGGHYLMDTGDKDGNTLGRSATLNDQCRFTVTFEDGLAHIENKGNTAKPSLRWNSSSNWFSCYKTDSTLPAGVAIYASIAYDEFTVAGEFENRALHMLDYDSEHLDENKNIGWCKDEEHGYYAYAKAAWNAMSEDERAAVSADGRARLAAWAVANGDVLNENSPIAAANNVRSSALKQNRGSIIAIASVLGAGALLTGGFFLLRKKREN
jgi:hypothetical protein